MTNCSKFGTYGNLPIIKAHPQAGKTSFIGVLNIGTFGHAISLENEIEVRAKSEPSTITARIAASILSNKYCANIAAFVACKYRIKLACWNVPTLERTNHLDDRAPRQSGMLIS